MSKIRLLSISIFGNALEFYDFTLYGVFAAVIASHFFPSSDPVASLIASWGAFAAGFLMRPFGASIFGYIGDKMGRKKALTLSIILMGVPTFIIGCLPAYDEIGIIAPAILILCRLLQGLCTGGEYNGAAIYALEHMGRDRPGLSSGMITGSCVIGALIATGVGSIALREGMPTWAWRVPFFLGALISVIGFYIRRNMSETPAFKASQKEHSSTKTTKIPLFEAFITHPKSTLLTMTLGGVNGALAYTLFGFSNMYLSRYIGLSITDAMHFNIIGLLSFCISCPLTGLLMDRMGENRYYLCAVSLIMISIGPVFLALQEASMTSIIVGQLMLGILTGSLAGPAHAYIQRLFPVRNRYSGISFNFSLGMALIGGTTPMILIKLIDSTQNLFVPALYLGGCALLLMSVLIFTRKHELEAHI
ncbi:MAG: MFS transporter [Gammaproteobacteria bacterium]|nr:MFS transporter [Gammaproteobacteria bacterium]